MDQFFGYGTSVYNVSAVSGVLVTRRDIYQQLGGLDPQYGDLALDRVLPARHPGQACASSSSPTPACAPPAHDHTTNDLPAIWRLRHQWARTHTHDPYYNPNYRTDRGDFVPARTDGMRLLRAHARAVRRRHERPRPSGRLAVGGAADALG